MERRPDIGLDSYDRFFPNQDTLPPGGFGNLIALPLERRSRDLANSVFVDERFRPYADQWEFLSTIRRITRSLESPVIPAKAGIHPTWVPAYAGTTAYSPFISIRGPKAHDHSEVEEIVRLAEAKGKVIGVRLAPAEDEDAATPC